MIGRLGFALGFQNIGSGQQGRDFDRERERAVSAVLFPAVFSGGGTIGEDIAGGALDHWHKAADCLAVQMALTPQHVGKQDREGALVHLDARPVGLAVEPEVLRPAAGGLLQLAQIIEDRQRRFRVARGQKAAGRLDQVARPHEMVAAKIVIAFRIAPGDRQAGNRGAGPVRGPVGRKHRRRDAIGVDPVFRLAIERDQTVLPLPPAGYEFI